MFQWNNIYENFAYDLTQMPSKLSDGKHREIRPQITGAKLSHIQIKSNRKSSKHNKEDQLEAVG